jgi:hypothetical protein
MNIPAYRAFVIAIKVPPKKVKNVYLMALLREFASLVFGPETAISCIMDSMATLCSLEPR